MRLNMVRVCVAQLALQRLESSKSNALKINGLVDMLEVSAAGELLLTTWAFSPQSLLLLVEERRLTE